jgi:DNA-binding NtrC family response regulator
VLTDPTVSRFRAELVVGDTRLLVRDLGSRNGTLVDGVSVVEAYARDGATLALGRSRLRVERAGGRGRVSLSPRTSFGLMTGRSAAMRETFARLERAAASDATVLLEGETGTGKEAAAELLESELCLLDRREVRRLVSNRHQPIDVRIVAATNRSLRREVNDKHFRPDLYYRLAVLEVRLPPLRERADDLPPLVDALLERLGAAGRPEAALVRSTLFLEAAARHPWPGNVRELRNYVERCMALGDDTSLEAPASLSDGAGAEIELGRPLREVREACARAVEGRYLAAMLQKHGDNVSAAARAADVDRIHFHRLLRRHGLR